MYVAQHFADTDYDAYLFFEDDMLFAKPDASKVCKSGFRRYIPHLIQECWHILKKERLDFLKLNFSEFFGTQSQQWAWYNVPASFRDKHWPKYPLSAKQCPLAQMDHIVSTESGVAYALGQIYLCNWPIFMIRAGNNRFYL